MKTITGDLLQLAADGVFDVVIHGCNCQCTMGKGVALAIKRRFPAAFEADLATTKGDPAKLGTISVAEIKSAHGTLLIVNAYTQLHWRGNGLKADYEAIGRAMREVKRRFSGMRIGYPRMGAGLGGGNWEQIALIIDQALNGEDHCLVEFAP